MCRFVGTPTRFVTVFVLLIPCTVYLWYQNVSVLNQAWLMVPKSCDDHGVIVQLADAEG